MRYILVVATNQDVLLFKLLTFLGVLLTETCYLPRRATARDFTVYIIADVGQIFATLLSTVWGKYKHHQISNFNLSISCFVF